MATITRPWQWAAGQIHTDVRDDQDHDALLIAQDQPCCLVGRVSTAQSIATSTFTDINHDNEFADTDGMYSGLAPITIAFDGYYWVAAGATWASAAGGLRVNAVSLNAGVVGEIATEIDATTVAGSYRHSANGGLSLVTSDVIRQNVWQSSGGALNVNARLSVVRVSGNRS
jgi:hypothetical protein